MTKTYIKFTETFQFRAGPRKEAEVKKFIQVLRSRIEYLSGPKCKIPTLKWQVEAAALAFSVIELEKKLTEESKPEPETAIHTEQIRIDTLFKPENKEGQKEKLWKQYENTKLK